MTSNYFSVDAFPSAIDALRHCLHDGQLRLNFIALAIGEERTRTELLPFLVNALRDDIKMLREATNELANFIHLIGGSRYVMHLIHPLETLASFTRDAVVRNAAIQSLGAITDELSARDLELHIIPTLKRLTYNVKHTSRTSACGLFTVVYPRASPLAKSSLRAYFHQLCHDATSKVRCAAAAALVTFVEVVELEFLRKDLLPDFVYLSQKQYSERLYALDACVRLAKRLPLTDLREWIIPAVQKFASDKDWSIRQCLARKFIELRAASGPFLTDVNLVSTFQSLLSDNEPMVRAVAVGAMKDFCSNLDQTIIITYIMPCVLNVLFDTCDNVRAALVAPIVAFIPMLGVQYTRQHLFPIVLIQLNEKCREVRLYILEKLNCVIEVIEVHQITECLLPAVIQHAMDEYWRIRLAINKIMPLLATKIDRALFDMKLRDHCLNWLNDAVAEVRETAAANMKCFIEHFGASWAEESIIAGILTLSRNGNYKIKITCLWSINAMAEFCGANIITKSLLPTILLLAKDRVANVRFNVAKTLQKISQFLDVDVIESQIVPTLAQLNQDNDSDVKYFANEAIMGIKI